MFLPFLHRNERVPVSLKGGRVWGGFAQKGDINRLNGEQLFLFP